ncbi:MAG: dihydrolipoyl dehydrogenase [Planctomycetes bacterium]|nr:dihydrolipoyl dehydrogenase [Planctomycetota bacterium]
MRRESFDVTVLGSGPGGYIAAIRASQLGRRVAIVESRHLGGVCLNWGCIPTKALLKIAEQYEFLQESSAWGFEIPRSEVNWDRVVQKSRAAADRLSKGVEFLMRKNKIEVLRGRGRFLSANRILVEGPEQDGVEVQTTHSIIATGGRPSTLPGIEPDGRSIITSKEAMVLPRIPKTMTVIGAGAIGLEFAYFYSVFGSEVTIVEYLPRILPGGDPEICEALARALRKRKIKIHTSSKVVGVQRQGEKVVTRVESGGATSELESELALVAIGVRGNVEDIGLEEIGVRTEKGFIPVDGHCQTNVLGVYAIGDVIGPPALAHAASAEGILAVQHLAGKDPEPIDYHNIPACIYCHPQVASVGLSEPEAIEAGYDVQVGRFPFSANGKAVAVGETTGLVKIIGERDSGEILGAHIIGPEATELIGELALARSAELTVHDIHHAIHSHPTLSESIMEAAADWAGEATGI